MCAVPNVEAWSAWGVHILPYPRQHHPPTHHTKPSGSCCTYSSKGQKFVAPKAFDDQKVVSNGSRDLGDPKQFDDDNYDTSIFDSLTLKVDKSWSNNQKRKK